MIFALRQHPILQPVTDEGVWANAQQSLIEVEGKVRRISAARTDKIPYRLRPVTEKGWIWWREARMCAGEGKTRTVMVRSKRGV